MQTERKVVLDVEEVKCVSVCVLGLFFNLDFLVFCHKTDITIIIHLHQQ